MQARHPHPMSTHRESKPKLQKNTPSKKSYWSDLTYAVKRHATLFLSFPDLLALSQTAINNQKLSREQYYWMHQLKLHYPRQTVRLTRQSQQSRTPINALNEFKQLYQLEEFKFRDFKNIHKTLILFKEGRLKEILGLRPISLDEFMRWNWNYCYWAALNKQQNILNYFCSIAMEQYPDVDINCCLGFHHAPRLYWAAALNYDDFEKILKIDNIQINNTNQYQETPLFIASEMGQTNVVQRLIEKKADVNLANNEGETPLHRACMNGQHAVVEHLISANANLERVNHQDETPLHIATRHKHSVVVEQLLIAKANVDALFAGHSALFYATRMGDSDIVGLLIAANANINLPSNAELLNIALRHSSELVEQLLELKPNIQNAFINEKSEAEKKSLVLAELNMLTKKQENHSNYLFYPNQARDALQELKAAFIRGDNQDQLNQLASRYTVLTRGALVETFKRVFSVSLPVYDNQNQCSVM